MGNWNVKRAELTLAELTENVADCRSEATEALREGGEYGLRYRQAVANLARSERTLESAQAKAEQRRKESELTPSEIVDKVMGR